MLRARRRASERGQRSGPRPPGQARGPFGVPGEERARAPWARDPPCLGAASPQASGTESLSMTARVAGRTSRQQAKAIHHRRPRRASPWPFPHGGLGSATLPDREVRGPPSAATARLPNGERQRARPHPGPRGPARPQGRQRLPRRRAQLAGAACGALAVGGERAPRELAEPCPSIPSRHSRRGASAQRVAQRPRGVYRTGERRVSMRSRGQGAPVTVRPPAPAEPPGCSTARRVRMLEVALR